MSDYLIKFLKQLSKILKQNIKNSLLFLSILYMHSTVAQNDLNSLLVLSHNRDISTNIKDIETKIIDVNYANYRNLFPTISLGLGEQVNFGRSFDPISGAVTPRYSWYNNSNFSVKVEQRLTSILHRKIDSKIHQNSLSIQELTNLENQKKIDIEIINNYYDCLLSKENMELSLFIKDLLVAANHGFEKLYKFGKMDTIALLNHNRKIIYIDKEIADFLSSYKKTQNKLKELAGFKDHQELFLKSPVIDSFKINFDHYNSDIVIRTRLVQKKVELDSLTWRKSKKQLFSNVSFYSSFGSYYSSVLNYQYDFWDQVSLNNFFNIGLRMDLPLYSREKKNSIEINRLNYELSSNKSKLELQQADTFWKEIRLDYENALSLYNNLKIIKDLSYWELCMNQKKYNNRTIPLTQLLESGVRFANYYKEYLYYRNNLYKRRDILQIVLN
ncbi:hypothetical protein AR687_16520 [Flavobacteriaceae bacterium CRH]|nr:hypothetical protein AR687_16520 [Flavobacteriaceae bacterium CRH]